MRKINIFTLKLCNCIEQPIRFMSYRNSCLSVTSYAVVLALDIQIQKKINKKYMLDVFEKKFKSRRFGLVNQFRTH